LKIGGASFAWLEQNRKSYFFQKFQHTSEEGSTSVLFAAIQAGYREDVPLLKVFTRF